MSAVLAETVVRMAIYLLYLFAFYDEPATRPARQITGCTRQAAYDTKWAMFVAAWSAHQMGWILYTWISAQGRQALSDLI